MGGLLRDWKGTSGLENTMHPGGQDRLGARDFFNIHFLHRSSSRLL